MEVGRMSSLEQLAESLGQGLGRTEEYQALRKAAQAVDEDREITELRNNLDRLEAELMAHLRSGKEPSEEDRERYEAMARDLQGRALYQRLVAAQANFDKILQKTNETMARAMQSAGESRIILPS
jgi:cell fate (sporulation/competence/biofilm development) regulator YlbF (YheA/YmcA/DUF963 family)